MPDSFITRSFGKLKLGFLVQREPVWLQFDENDTEISKKALIDTGKKMLFILHSEMNLENDNFYVYLGDIDTDWNPEFSIQLSRDYKHLNIWSAKKGQNDLGDDEDVDRIQKGLWCAGSATITLCSYPSKPVLLSSPGEAKTVQTVIELSYDKWYLDLYNGVRADLKELNKQSDITSPFKGKLDTVTHNEDLSDSPAFELFLILQRIYNPLIQRLHAIAKSPASKVENSIQNYYVNSSSLNYIRNTNILRVNDVQKVIGKTIPRSFLGRTMQMSCDIPENRLAKTCIKRLGVCLDIVAKELSAYITEIEKEVDQLRKNNLSQNSSIHQRNQAKELEKHKRAYDNIEKNILHTRQKKQLFNFCRDEDSFDRLLETELLSYDFKYASIKSSLKELESSIKYYRSDDIIDPSTVAIPFQVAPFHAVYQRWCFTKIIDALFQLGFYIPQTSVQPKLTRFYRNPMPNQLNCSMVHNDLFQLNRDFRVDIFYEKIYPRPGDPHSEYGLETRKALTSWDLNNPSAVKYSPDIALEFWGLPNAHGCPVIVIFDPTTGKFDNKKFWYQNSLRHFIKKGSDGESLRIVKASWGIFPNYEGNDRTDRYYVSSNSTFSEGFIVLNHFSSTHLNLKETVRTILNNALELHFYKSLLI